MKRARWMMWAALALVLAGARCHGADEFWDGVVATVNGEALTFNDVDEDLDCKRELRELNQKFKGDELTAQRTGLRVKTLHRLVDERLIEQQFWAGGGWFPSDAADKAVERVIREQYQGNAAHFHTALAWNGETLEEFKASILRSDILDLMNREMVEKKVVANSTTPPDKQREQLRAAWLAGLHAKADIELRPNW